MSTHAFTDNPSLFLLHRFYTSNSIYWHQSKVTHVMSQRSISQIFRNNEAPVKSVIKLPQTSILNLICKIGGVPL